MNILKAAKSKRLSVQEAQRWAASWPERIYSVPLRIRLRLSSNIHAKPWLKPRKPWFFIVLGLKSYSGVGCPVSGRCCTWTTGPLSIYRKDMDKHLDFQYTPSILSSAVASCHFSLECVSECYL